MLSMTGRLHFILVLLFEVCQGIQNFEETPQYTEVNPGQDAKLVCRVLSKQGQCIWQKDQKPIGMHLKKYEWVGSPDMGDCSLWVRTATLEFDDGLWQCQVTASDFTTQDALTSEPARLVVRVSPQRPQIEYAGAVILPGSNVTARVGEIASLTCTARYGNPSPLIKWYLGELELRTLRPQVNSTEIDNPRTWSTKSVCDILADRSRHSHPIRCVAVHPAYSSPTMSSSTEVRFDVRYAPETRLVGVPIGQLEEGRDRLEIRCVADANPTASILWSRKKDTAEMEVATIGETLKFSPIYRNHAAVYVCVATNTEGESSPVSIQISVNYSPKIISVGPDRMSTALLYSGASFECLADAMPSAEYRWAQVFSDGRAPIECGVGQRLILTNVTYAQQGQYICLASNKINGKLREVKSSPVSLQVVGAPRVVKPTSSEKFVVSTTEGSPARLEIRLCSDPKPRLVAWEWGSTRLHAGEVLESRYRALDLEPLASEDCYIAILEFTHTIKEDQRLYYVIVENDHGSDRRALMLRVNEPAQIPLVIGAVAGFTVLSILIMGFVCFLRSDRCCVPRNAGPTLQQVHCTKASNAMIEDPRLPGVDTMERAAQQFVQEKRQNNHVLKPVPTQQYPQDCYDHEAHHPQSHYQRHHHHSQPPPLHGPQYTLQLQIFAARCFYRRANCSATVVSLEGPQLLAPKSFHTLLIIFFVITLCTPNEIIMPARKGAKKRAATATIKDVKPSKVTKKKEEVKLRPDLRRITDSGFVLSVGQGDVGQLGLGTKFMEKMRPTMIPGCENVVCIAAGGMHSVCLTKEGTVLTFGCNDEGALGRDTSVEGSETTPQSVELNGKAVQVTAGDSHSAALMDDGRVFAWGSFRDSHGNMGLTTQGNERAPVQIMSGYNVIKISSGADHLVLLTDEGHVYTCGCAEQGQLGRICPRSADRHSRRGTGQLLQPGIVYFNNSRRLKIDEIWAGSYCTFAKIHETDEIYAFGLNNYHQLGLESTETYSFPSRVKTFSGRKWIHISSGQHHTLALDEAGQVFVLGRKEYGRLGLGDNCDDAKELTAVPTFSNMKCIDVAAGSAQSFAITETGDLYAWGMGSNGQLGTGEEDDVFIPIGIKGKRWINENKVAARVVGGGQHTLILVGDPPIKAED